MDIIRRLSFALLVLVAASMTFRWWRDGREGYGLLSFLRGEKPEAVTFTPPQEPQLKPQDVPGLASLSEEFSKLSAAVLPSVVSINTKTVRQGQRMWHPYFGVISGRPQVIPGLGSGAIISKEGHVVTNYHVIEDVSEILVTTNDNKKYPAKLLGASRVRDIALLKMEANGRSFPALTFSNSDQAKVGQLVFAVGNPFGLSGTVTQGIISARDRHLSDSQLDYLQTDSVINPGNSGGPLVDVHGQILGINVAIYRGDENVRAWQGVGLAVPSNDVKTVIDAVLAQAQGQPATSPNAPGYLGLVLGAEIVAVDMGRGKRVVGAYVSELESGSPALQAGLRAGDVITALNGSGLKGPRDLLNQILLLKPGTMAVLTIVREDEAVDIEVKVGQRPDH